MFNWYDVSTIITLTEVNMSSVRAIYTSLSNLSPDLSGIRNAGITLSNPIVNQLLKAAAALAALYGIYRCISTIKGRVSPTENNHKQVFVFQKSYTDQNVSKSQDAYQALTSLYAHSPSTLVKIKFSNQDEIPYELTVTGADWYLNTCKLTKQDTCELTKQDDLESKQNRSSSSNFTLILPSSRMGLNVWKRMISEEFYMTNQFQKNGLLVYEFNQIEVLLPEFPNQPIPAFTISPLSSSSNIEQTFSVNNTLIGYQIENPPVTSLFGNHENANVVDNWTLILSHLVNDFATIYKQNLVLSQSKKIEIALIRNQNNSNSSSLYHLRYIFKDFSNPEYLMTTVENNKETKQFVIDALKNTIVGLMNNVLEQLISIEFETSNFTPKNINSQPNPNYSEDLKKLHNDLKDRCKLQFVKLIGEQE